MIKHFKIWKNGKKYYLCNLLLNAKKEKLTSKKAEVTCEKCLRQLGCDKE